MKKLKNTIRIKYITSLITIIALIAGSTLISYFFNGSKLFSSFHYYIKYSSFGLALGFAFWVGHNSIAKYLKRLDWKKNPKRSNLISLLSFIIYGMIICPLIPYIYYRFVWGFSGQDLFLNELINSLMIFSIDLIVISIFYSTSLTKIWIQSIENNEELKRENLLAKYEALKNQVNPHFLFNNLNTLIGIVEQRSELTTDFIKKLSDIYRYVLDQNDKELVSINDELKFVNDYVFLTKMRFGNGLIFNSSISNEHLNLRVIPLGIQMLVENAIKHNIISDDMPLKIDMEIEAGYVVVKNNLQKKRRLNSDKEPLGLDNLKKRYAYLSKSSVDLVETESEFIVKLPIIES